MAGISTRFIRHQRKKHIEEHETGSELLEGRNILLAEDNDLNAEIAKTILENAGLKIDCVEDDIQCVNRIMEMPAGTYDTHGYSDAENEWL